MTKIVVTLLVVATVFGLVVGHTASHVVDGTLGTASVTIMQALGQR
jgi:hypothetical protein